MFGFGDSGSKSSNDGLFGLFGGSGDNFTPTHSHNESTGEWKTHYDRGSLNREIDQAAKNGDTLTVGGVKPYISPW